MKRSANLGHTVVHAKQLDEILRSLHVEKVDRVKIDVEDAELEALQGLRQTMKDYRPNLIFESKGQML